MSLRRLANRVVTCLALTTSGCSSSSSTPTTPDGGSPLGGPLPDHAMALSIAIDVAPKSETHKCRFVKVSEAIGKHVATMRHAYTPGSHHLVLFRTDLTEIPAGSEDVMDCFAGGRDVMLHARGIVYASQAPTGEVVLPAGVGLSMKSGEVLLLQAHYLNAGGSSLAASVEVQLIGADEASIKEEAGVLFFYDPFIWVPPAAKASALMRCSIPKDIELLTGFSHMHKRGVGFAAYLDAVDGSMSAEPFYKSAEWDHPEALAKPLAVSAGQGVRFRCDYQNSPDSSEVIQGQSAEVNEMCVFTALYHPAMTENDDLCIGHADMVGAGDQSCSKTLSCVQACPAGTAPKFGGGLVAAASIHPCWQKCFAASCPTAAKPLFSETGCVREKCASECTDSSSSACSGCVGSKCLDEYSACSSHACP